MDDLWGEIGEITDKNDALIVELRESGAQLAKNDRDYREALAKATLEEREKGTPVTAIRDTLLGRPDISRLRYLRNCSEVIYKATQEAINANKLKLRILDSQLNREWSQAGMGGY